MRNGNLDLNEYQKCAAQTDQNLMPGQSGLELPTLGLFGETGSLLSALKKKQRDKDSYFAYQESVIEEFGDTLWYLSNIASRVKLQLTDLASTIEKKSETREIRTFSHLQECVKESSGGKRFAIGLLDLASVVGKALFALSNDHADRRALATQLGEVLAYIARAANKAQVQLSEAAANNISKTMSRWPVKRKFTPLFDTGSPLEEQLPRKLEITLAEKIFNNKTFVMQQCKGINIGDRLTDNRTEQDDYRFHDVFHLAYAAVLGWSPVTRALLKLKRKSNPKKDENEDGARAMLLEECISTWVFNKGGRFKFYENIDSVDYDLLKSISYFVQGYEVAICPLWMWEHAILEGYKVFRFMKKHRAGIVTLDLSQRTINVRRK